MTTRPFNRFLLDVEVARNLKLIGLTDAEKWTYVAGVLPVAAKSPTRGVLLVGRLPATHKHVAAQAGVSDRVARSTIDKLLLSGVLVEEHDLGCYRVNDWEQWQVEPKGADPTAARRQALHRDKALRDEIRERDRGRCRYCHVEVAWNDRRGTTGGTYDHIDPSGDNSRTNVVVACRACNSRKGQRTPREAGMDLLPIYSEPATDLPKEKEKEKKEEQPLVPTGMSHLSVVAGEVS